MKFDPRELSVKDAHHLLVSAVLPRPIALVSTVGPDGVFNLAPYSYFSVLGVNPPMAGLGIGFKRDGSKKDTLVNIESTGDFVINTVTEPLAERMNQASFDYPREIDEFEMVGLTPQKSDLVRSPLVAESPVTLECRLDRVLGFGQKPEGQGYAFVIGEIVRIHVRDELLVGTVVKADRWRPIGRLGEDLYCRISDRFEMKRPDKPAYEDEG